ncbi:arylformamidase [Piscinibacter sakaiensis]|uniref:arylformamidase n=1 Tax=Piscinibacter sakaiensis TaxID=1547922 RepID=UPI003AAB2D53
MSTDRTHNGPGPGQKTSGASVQRPRRIWDISPPLHAATPPFPGDTAYQQQWAARIGPGCPVNVSAITMSPHLGAHADAPLHYADSAAAIGAVDLLPYLGRCRVIHAIDVGPLIRPEHLADAADDLPPRVLVRSCRTAPLVWSDEFSAFAAETIDWLADRGVLLVGIDSQSVDPAASKDLPSHHRLLARDMRVLENLVLDEVQAGDYELIALPLKLVEADASPVRAVLREL